MGAANNSIVVLGSANVDLIVRGPRLPRPGETVLGGEFLQAAGGKGANQAVAAARLGGNVTFLAAVGDDDFGRAALGGCRSEGIDCRYLRCIERTATGTALILVDRSGENMISVASGANALLTPEDVDRVPDDVFRMARVFLASLEVPLATVVRGLERARAHNVLTILNPAPANQELVASDMLRLVDVLTPNEGEAQILAGSAHQSEGESATLEQARQAALDWQRLGAKAVVVTLGRYGCLVVDRQQLHMPGLRVEAVDATAAGDAFNGGLAVALAEGRSLEEAADWANRVAAISVSRLGAQPSLPRRDEIGPAG